MSSREFNFCAPMGRFVRPAAATSLCGALPFARLEARFVSDSRDLSVATVIEPASRSYTLNGKRRAAQDLQGILPAVAFSPTILSLRRAPKRPSVPRSICLAANFRRIIALFAAITKSFCATRMRF